ncbi:MAG: DedA family protein [Pseudomonas sp.]
METLLTGNLLGWLSDHQQWLGLSILIITLLESLAIAGLLVPGVVLLLATTAMAGGTGMPLTTVLLWAYCGAVIGDMLSFALGRYFHQDIRRLGVFRKHPQWINRGETFFRRYGVLSILLGRFIGPIRPIIPMIAGMFDMPVWRFVTVNLLSALLWAPVYIIPGYLAGHAAGWEVPEFFWHQTLGLLAAASALLILALLALSKQQRWSALAAAGLCLIGLAVLAFAKEWMQVLEQSLLEWSQEAEHSIPALLSPLADISFALLLGALLAIGLLFGSTSRHRMIPLLSLLFCLLLSTVQALPYAYLPLALSLTLGGSLLLLCNRPLSFWMRNLCALALLPTTALLITASLNQAAPSLIALVAAMLQAAAACLLSLWLVERAVPLTPLGTRTTALLLVAPLIAAALALSGLHFL